MNQQELADACARLHTTYSGRLPEDGLEDVRQAAEAGEWREAVDVLLAGLDQHHVTITGTERLELAQLALATGLDATRVARLTVT